MLVNAFQVHQFLLNPRALATTSATGGVPRERLDDFGFRAQCEAIPGGAEEGLQGRIGISSQLPFAERSYG